MKKETLKHELEEAVASLIKMARDTTWNKFSDNYVFLVNPESDGVSFKNAFDRIKHRKKVNDRKKPSTLDSHMAFLEEIYEQIYLLDLYIYKAEKKRTIIEIIYVLKSSLTEEFRETVIKDAPRLHSKVAIPFWQGDRKDKFDINWEHHSLWHVIKMRLKYRLTGKK